MPNTDARTSGRSQTTETQRMEFMMGVADDAKETVRSAARKVTRAVEDSADRVKDKADEIRATAKLKAAETELDSVSHRNRAKKSLRGD